MNRVIDQIAGQRALPVLRSRDVDDAVETARACAGAGLRVIELTQSTPDVERAVERLVEAGLTVGVGTITEATQVEAAVSAGATFIVSFTNLQAVAEAAEGLGVAHIPGALTPTEVFAAARTGAAAVKLFPGRLITPDYIRDLHAVLPSVELIVTGGIRARPEDVATWIRAGAIAVGVGSDLGTVAEVGRAEVQRRCADALATAPNAAASV